MRPSLPSDITNSRSDHTTLSPSNLVDTSRYGWFELSWPTLGFCALIICIFAATQPGGQISWSVMTRMWSFLSAGASKGRVEPARVLVITSNPAHRLSIVATLSPRGLEPLLAENAEEVNAALAAHGG